MGSDFEMIEGEGILRAKTRLSEGKIKIWHIKEKKKWRIKNNKRAGWKRNRRKTKKKKIKKQAKMAKLKFEMKERVGKGSHTNWYLKYSISEALEITLTKWYNNYPTHNQLAKFVKGIERTQVF